MLALSSSFFLVTSLSCGLVRPTIRANDSFIHILFPFSSLLLGKQCGRLVTYNMISSCFGQISDNVGRNSRCYINSRRRASLGKETEQVCLRLSFVVCICIRVLFRCPRTCSLASWMFSRISWRWLGEFSRGSYGKVSTIHLALPVRSLRLTRREEFAQFPDNESRKLPATEISTRECDRCTMRPLNIAPIRSYDPESRSLSRSFTARVSREKVLIPAA